MKNRKILSAVITAALLVGSVTPSYTAFAESAWAAGNPAAGVYASSESSEITTEDGLRTALAAGGSIVLKNDITPTKSLTVDSGKTVALDLAGHTLNCNFDGHAIVVKGSLTISDTGTGGKIERTASYENKYCLYVAGGTAEFTGGLLTDSNKTNLTTVNVSGGGKFTLSGGTLKSDGKACLVKIDSVSGGAVSKSNASKFIMTGGTLTATNSTGVTTDVQLGSLGAAASDGSNWAAAINNYCNVEITGGTINGIVWANDDGDCSAPEIKISGADTTINGIIQVGSDYLTSGTSGLKVNMTGGTLNGGIAYTQCAENAGASWIKDGDLSITGGTLNLTGVKLPDTLNAADSPAKMTVGSNAGVTVKAGFPTASLPVLNTALPADKQLAADTNGNVVTLSREPEGYGGLTLVANADKSVYGVTLTEEQLKVLSFSAADASIGRGDGYHAGFHVDALDKEKYPGITVSYKRTTTYVADLSDSTIKGIAAYADGSSTDGQFWIGFQRSWLGRVEKARYLIYAVEATYGSDKAYYYIAVDQLAVPEDFAFNGENCTGTHGDDPCTICGNRKIYDITDITESDAGGTIEIKIDGKDVTQASKDDEVTVIMKPAAGYEPEIVVVNKGEAIIGGSFDPTDAAKYIFTMPGGNVTVNAIFKKSEKPVTKIELNKTELGVAVGDTSEALTVTYTPADTTQTKAVTWETSDNTIATVTDGKVTGVKAGTAVITAKFSDTIKATCTVTVEAVKTDKTETITDARKFTKTAADGKTYSEDYVKVLSAAEVKAAKSVTVKVTSDDGAWTASKEVDTAYKTVKHAGDEGTTTLTAGSDYMIAVHVSDIPVGKTIKYDFTFNK